MKRLIPNPQHLVLGKLGGKKLRLRLRRSSALKRDLRTSAFIRAGALLRRNEPVPGILAAHRPGALMHKSGLRSLLRQTQVLPMS